MTAPQTPTPLQMPGAQAGIQAVQAQGASAAPQQPPAPAPVANVVPPATPPAAPPAPPAPQAAPQVPAAAQPPAPDQPPADPKQPPWGSAENFDPDRAWRLIENLRTELSEYRTRTDPIVEQHEAARRAALDESTRLQEDLTKSTAALEAWRTNAVQAAASAMAATRFIDADAALALVGDLSQFATQDQVDTTRLTQAFDELASSKPHLVAQQQQQPRGFGINRGQGASGTPVTAAQVAQNAESQGDWRGSLAAKVQQLSELPRQ